MASHVPYDSMQQQIERVTSGYLAQAGNQSVNASKPLMSYKKGTISIEFKVDEFSRGNLLDVVDILNQYYNDKFELNLGMAQFQKYSLVAELRKGMFQKPREEDKIKVSFGLNTYDGSFDKKTNTLTFEKGTDLSQEEINCFLEVWKKYALKPKAEEAVAVGNVRENLSELGALVYKANHEFTWGSMAGYEKTKQEIRDTIILPFKHPEIYKNIGELARTHFITNVPRAVLFEGPPGTGKTTMARIIANESDAQLVYVPIESIMSMWYGVSEKKLSAIFDYCSELEKSILFLDEIDSLAGSRDNEMHEATRRILSVLLRKMQGFLSVDNVLTIGATNRADDLDEALISRFNRIISFPLPSQAERGAIFSYYAKHLEAENIEKLAKLTDSKSGRDIEDICGDAERIWASKIISDKSEVTAPSFEIYLEAIKSKSNN